MQVCGLFSSKSCSAKPTLFRNSSFALQAPAHAKAGVPEGG
jgi:hypothetical protein